MSRYWSSLVHELSPYVPGEQPKLQNLVKLNTNEMPYGPSPHALAAIREAADDSLRLYPDPNSDVLREAIARQCGVSPGHVFVGNGSDEVLAHAFMGLLRHDDPLWYPDITYSFYPVYCKLYGIQSVQIPVDENYAIDPAAFLPGPKGRAGAIIIANPNAPTGCALTRAEIERIVAGNPGVVVVIDEAYVDFGGESAVPLVADYDNLLVVQTLSKSRGLAGLRVGFAIGSPELLQALDRVKNSFNSYPMDRLAIAGATAAMDDAAYTDKICQAVIDTRETLSAALREQGFQVLPSKTNFVFARHPRFEGAELAAALRERGVLVRHFAKPRIDQFLRISIGTDAQCRVLLEALEQILG